MHSFRFILAGAFVILAVWAFSSRAQSASSASLSLQNPPSFQVEKQVNGVWTNCSSNDTQTFDVPSGGITDGSDSSGNTWWGWTKDSTNYRIKKTNNNSAMNDTISKCYSEVKAVKLKMDRGKLSSAEGKAK